MGASAWGTGIWVYVCTSVRVHECVGVCVYRYMGVCVYGCMCMGASVRRCMGVYRRMAYVCVCVRVRVLGGITTSALRMMRDLRILTTRSTVSCVVLDT